MRNACNDFFGNQKIYRVGVLLTLCVENNYLEGIKPLCYDHHSITNSD